MDLQQWLLVREQFTELLHFDQAHTFNVDRPPILRHSAVAGWIQLPQFRLSLIDFNANDGVNLEPFAILHVVLPHFFDLFQIELVVATELQQMGVDEPRILILSIFLQVVFKLSKNRCLVV